MMNFARQNPPSRGFGRKLLAALGAAVLPLAIAACGGGNGVVGKGNGPDHLVVTSNLAAAGASYFQMYECFRAKVQAILYFKDGSAGDYTSRVIWSSSSPGTVTVSNGDQPIPNSSPAQFYANGVVTPVGGGTAVITANYFGLTASIGVSVGTPQSLTVKRIIQGNTVLPPALPSNQVQTTGNSLTSTGFSMGVNTTETLTVVAQLDGQEQNVASAGIDWHFQVPNDGEATINSNTGVITAITAGAPLIAVVGFDSCTYTASTQVTVANITSISMTPEFAGDPTAVPPVPQPQLVVGNTEKVNVYAQLDNGATQDISTQAQLASSDNTVVLFGVTGASNIASALIEGGPVNISASFTQGGSQQLIASNLQIGTVLASLEAIRITSLPRPPNNLVTPTLADTVPPDCSTATAAEYVNPPTAVVFTTSTIPLQFCVQGVYANGTIQQDITRQITWTLSDPLAAIAGSSKPQTAGQALAASTTEGTIQVTATPPSQTVGPLMVPLTISD